MLRVQRIIWFALLLSTVIYAVIAYLFGGEPHRPFDRTAVVAVYVAAIVDFAIATFFPLASTQPPQTQLIVRLALYEACAVMGLMIAFVFHDFRLYVGLWALALIGFASRFPR